MRSKLLFISFVFILFLAGFHMFSTYYYVYWTNDWTDHLTHFVGGAALGLLALWLYYVSGVFKRRVPTSEEVFFLCILSAFVVGIMWEGFEYSTGIISWSSRYPLDTVGDLVSDIFGGLLASVIGRHKKLYE